MQGVILVAALLNLTLRLVLCSKIDERDIAPNDDIFTHVKRLEEKVEKLTSRQNQQDIKQKQQDVQIEKIKEIERKEKSALAHIQVKLGELTEEGKRFRSNVTDKESAQDSIIEDVQHQLVQVISENKRQDTLIDLLWKQARGSSKENPALSCKSIKKSNPRSPNGMYWIKLNESALAYCDMESGGWMMVSSLKVTNESQKGKLYWKTVLSDDHLKLTEVQNKRFLLSSIGLRTLQSHVNFTQMRFRCKKEWHNRVLDIYTSPSPLGRSVVDYMLDRISFEDRPVSCNSYLRGEEDNSIIATHCDKWDNHNQGPSRWGWLDYYLHARPYGGLAGIPYVRWVALLPTVLLCDDYGNEEGYSSLGEWNYFVR